MSRRMANYGLTAVFVAASIVLTGLLEKVLRPTFPGQVSSPLLLIAVAASARVGGHGPGLVSVLLSLFSLQYVFLPPLGSLELDWADGPRMATFVGVALTVSCLVATQRREATALKEAEAELTAARTIQQRMFPESSPTVPGFDISGASVPAAATSGDHFDYIPLCDGSLGIVIGDASGHGLGSALIMTETRAYLRALAMHRDDLGEILTRTNRLLYDDTDEGQFVTLFMLSLDSRTRRFTYSGAGHDGFLLDPSGDVRRLRSTNIPLGLVPDARYSDSPPLILQPGQMILLVTDGVFEAPMSDGTLFGIDRTLETVRASGHRAASEIVASLHREVHDVSRRDTLPDDLTSIVIKAARDCPSSKGPKPQGTSFVA